MSSRLHEIAKKLEIRFESREALNIARILVEHLPDLNVSAEEAISRVLAGEPVQYITGAAWFYNRRFEVTPDVLIPRPETEELVHWIRSENLYHRGLRILDIGTGSGCIAVSLDLELSEALVEAIDISPEALAVGRRNSLALGASVDFHECDFLAKPPSGDFDIVVSNPPYVSREEFEQLEASVKAFEPRVALGHESGDPDIFYQSIAKHYSASSNVEVFIELNEFRSAEIKRIFSEFEYQTELRQDLQGKDRMLKAWK